MRDRQLGRGGRGQEVIRGGGRAGQLKRDNTRLLRAVITEILYKLKNVLARR